VKNFVFVGDSVTDCDRKRSKKYAHTEAALGHGWVKILAQTVLAEHVVWNRGYAGYRTADTLIDQDSWPESLDHADVTTLMIGINDIWHTLKQDLPYDEDEIVKHFERLVSELKTRSDSLIIMEPVALVYDEVDERWLPKMKSLFTKFKTLADYHQVQWLSIQSEITVAAGESPGVYLFDGVHPSEIGHQWIAKRWAENVPTALWLD
jgi:lysophospholipase L1-like esterase